MAIDLDEIVVPVLKYLDESIDVTSLIRIVDDLVSDNYLARIEARAVPLVEALHETLALVVDAETRKEEPKIYIGEKELRIEAAKFYRCVMELQNSNPKP